MKSSISVWVLINFVGVLGYDGYTTCTKPFRGGKRLDVPCDFTTQTWCTIPGSYYPWRAVRRFVYENHGLMRRMYGDERHISVLRSEIESNDVEYQSEKWTHDSNLKHFKQKKDEYKSASKSTTPPPSTTTTSTTTQQPDITNKTTTRETPSTTNQESTTDSEFSTTEFDIESTTEFLTTTQKTETTSKPLIFQDTLEKSTTTTEKAQLFYKSRGVNACPVKEEVVAPFWANNTRGEVLALLNLYPFEQYVHWERCTFENKQMFCREGCRCEQQYRLHRLLAYDPTNDCRGIFSDWFKFPSCCVCRCYDLPGEFRLTSRSPRKQNEVKNEKVNN
ncbi:protein spaetzle 4 isoform X1 [Cimex lectularius]|uniref:Spaetzle domain-containing protein n=1 Tax=Cimex lectularius TaxID=79782 RepID=A0A8I6S695_CIMLE|nr:protein spaetzle 4 isoform X1 [Cimex lectularius]